MLWVYEEYVTGGGLGAIREEWLPGLSRRAQSKLEVRLRILGNLPLTEWVEPYCRQKLKNHEVGEIRFTGDGRQYRVLGFFSGDRYIMVLGCDHKGQVYNPRDALDRADRRRGEVERKERSTREFNFPR